MRAAPVLGRCRLSAARTAPHYSRATGLAPAFVPRENRRVWGALAPSWTWTGVGSLSWVCWPCPSSSPQAGGRPSGAVGPLVDFSCIKFCDLCSWLCVVFALYGAGGRVGFPGVLPPPGPRLSLHPLPPALTPHSRASSPQPGGFLSVMHPPPANFPRVLGTVPLLLVPSRGSPGLCAGYSPLRVCSLLQKQRGSCGWRRGRAAAWNHSPVPCSPEGAMRWGELLPSPPALRVPSLRRGLPPSISAFTSLPCAAAASSGQGAGWGVLAPRGGGAVLLSCPQHWGGAARPPAATGGGSAVTGKGHGGSVLHCSASKAGQKGDGWASPPPTATLQGGA